VQGLQDCPTYGSNIIGWKCQQSTILLNKLNPLVMSLTPRLKVDVDHNLPIFDTTLKNKDIVIDQQTNQNVIQEDEHVNFQSEVDIEDEPSSCVKWLSDQSNLDAKKENLNPNEVLIPNVFVGLSPLQELGKVLVNFPLGC